MNTSCVVSNSYLNRVTSELPVTRTKSVTGPSRAHRRSPRGFLRGGEERTPARKNSGIAGLQQLYRRDLQRVALHVSADVHTKVILLVGRLKRLHNLGIPIRIELQELLVLRHNAISTCRTLDCARSCMRVRGDSHFLRAV